MLVKQMKQIFISASHLFTLVLYFLNILKNPILLVADVLFLLILFYFSKDTQHEFYTITHFRVCSILLLTIGTREDNVNIK